MKKITSQQTKVVAKTKKIKYFGFVGIKEGKQQDF